MPGCSEILLTCTYFLVNTGDENWLDNEDMPYICYEYVVVNIVKTEAREKLQGSQLPALQNQ